MKRPTWLHAPDRRQSADRRFGPRLSAVTLLWLLLAASIVVALPGCRGCWNEDPLARLRREEDEEKKKREKPKPDFEVSRPQIVPFDSGSQQLQFVKHGHWMGAVQPVKANNFDFQAEIESTCARTGGEAIEIPNTAYRLQTWRPAALPKGQQKLVETTHFLVPPPRATDALGTVPRVNLETRLRARHGGREVTYGREPTTTMPAYQYFLVVLSDNADRYGYLKLLASVTPPIEDDSSQMLEGIIHYRVLLPKTDEFVPVPPQPLQWTPIACVVWDAMDPNRLTPPQQQAMLDWLHWGGQLIISGPNSLDLLRGSFLEDYLPASSVQAVSLPIDRFAELDSYWSVVNQVTKEPAALGLPEGRPLVGVDMQPRPGAVEVGSTGGLVFERPVGGGRIVVTAFSLADRQILNWGSFDSFLNGALLRRPPRKFALSPEMHAPQVDWAEFPGRALQMDSNYVTQVRFFTRDVSPTAPRSAAGVPVSGSLDAAAWNDTSGASEAARTSLREAAGISIPKADFVLRVLAIYLVVLVPVNWCVFRLIGRVEWAWLAALFVAVGAAVAVVRLAQLDIGFARSRTEIAVLELRGGYPRGHLTRYTALYTSLSTGYRFQFDDDSAVALPFPANVPWSRSPLDAVQTVSLRRERELVFTGFQVASNSTGMVHSEQMLDVGGGLELLGDAGQGWAIRNGTQVMLKDAGILHRLDDGQVELAWVGDLDAGGMRPLRFSTADDPKDLFQGDFAGWRDGAGQGELTLQRMAQLACGPWSQAPGGFRLVAWTDQEFEGLKIYPRASQSVLRTFVLAELRRGSLPAARPDVNLKAPFDLPLIPAVDETGLDEPARRENP